MQGVLTAIVTPFTSDGVSIDWESFECLVKAQIAGGVSAIVVVSVI